MRLIATIIVTAILASAFWIFYFHIAHVPAAGPVVPGKVLKVDSDGRVAAAGDKATVGGKPGLVVAESLIVGPAGLAIPVAGIKPSELTDTFTAARAGGARRHDAIDIMAAEGRPVLAAAPGTVEKLFFSNGGGGITAYVRSDDKAWSYYYAHLSAYAPGLAEGQRVERGTVIGFVGHTGDASPDGPHLHFAINSMAPGEKWYQGTPINPFPLLAGQPVAR